MDEEDLRKEFEIDTKSTKLIEEIPEPIEHEYPPAILDNLSGEISSGIKEHNKPKGRDKLSKRIKFNSFQTTTLQMYFEMNDGEMTGVLIDNLSKVCDLTPQQVRKWFINHRYRINLAKRMNG